MKRGIFEAIVLSMACAGGFLLAGCNSPAGNAGAPDYTQINLPDGAIARLGKGCLSSRNHSVAFSPDGRTLAVATRTGVWLCDVRSMREYALLKDAGSERGWDDATSVAFSPDGTLLAIGYVDGWVKLWSVPLQRVTTRIQAHEKHDQIVSVTFSPDGALVASLGGGMVKLWLVSSGSEVTTLKGRDGSITAIAFSPDGTTLAAAEGNRDPRIKIWSVVGLREQADFACSGSWIVSVAFSPDGQALASTSNDGVLILWSVAERRQKSRRKGGYRSAVFSHDGTMLACGCVWSDQVTVWSFPGGREIARLDYPGKLSIESLAFSPDDGALVARCWCINVVLWSVAGGECIGTLDEYTPPVHSLDFSPDGTRLLSGGWMWSVPQHRLQLTLEESSYASAFSPDGTWVAAGANERDMKLFSVKDGREVASLERLVQDIRQVRVSSISWSPDGELIATRGRMGSLILWSVADRKEIASLPDIPRAIQNPHVAFSPDGQRLAGWGADNAIRLWAVPDLSEVGMLEGHAQSITSVAFSPDGMLLASGSHDQCIKLWSLTEQRVIATIATDAPVISVAFIRKRNALMSTHPVMEGDRAALMVKLWDVDSHREIATRMINVLSGVHAVSPNGKILALGSGLDGTIQLWDMERIVGSLTLPE